MLGRHSCIVGIHCNYKLYSHTTCQNNGPESVDVSGFYRITLDMQYLFPFFKINNEANLLKW